MPPRLSRLIARRTSATKLKLSSQHRSSRRCANRRTADVLRGLWRRAAAGAAAWRWEHDRGIVAREARYFAPTRRIIAPEQQGHGHTRDLDRPLSYVQMAEDTAQLLQQLGIRDADVVGWSDGGIVGLILAARHPDLVRRLVASGANIAPSGLVPDGLTEITQPVAESSEERAHAARASADPPEHNAAFQTKLHDMWRNHPTEAELSVADLKKIAAPTLVVAADRDLILLDHTVLIYRSIPHAELLILPGSNHNTFGGRAKWINPIIEEFLEKKLEPKQADKPAASVSP